MVYYEGTKVQNSIRRYEGTKVQNSEIYEDIFE